MARRTSRRGVEHPAPPRPSAPDLPDTLERLEGVARGDDVEDAEVTGLSGVVEAGRTIFTACRVPGIDADRMVLTDARLADVVLDSPRITSLEGRGVRMRRVLVVGGRLGSCDLGEADLEGVEFRGVRIDYLGLARAALEDLAFVDCRIGTLDLPGATVSRVALRDCRADEVGTDHLRANDLDLRGLDAGRWTSVAGLRGATMTVDQVAGLLPDLARHVGIDLGAD